MTDGQGPVAPKIAGVAALAVLTTSALVLWIVSPRFDLKPSLIDDWAAIAKSPAQAHDMVRFGYHETGRFRPGWSLWNYLQWHTIGGATSLVGPNLWGVARLVLFAAGSGVFTALLLLRRARSLGRWWAVCLSALPAALVVTTPKFGVDLARFGPQEPALMGGMMLGGSLLFLGSERLLAPVRSNLATAALLVTGYALWLYGVYQKETSVCVVFLLPIVLVERHRLARWLAALDGRRRMALLALAVLVVLPLVHVAYETSVIARRGELIYGTTVEANRQGVDRFITSLRLMSSAIDSRIGWALAAAVGLGILISFVRRRPDWVAVALSATATAALVWSSQSGVSPSRYYLPTLALLAVALAVQIVALRGRVRWVVTAAALVLAAWSLTDAHSHVEAWARGEHRENRFVEDVARIWAGGCPVVVTGLDVERSAALPVLVRAEGGARGRCGDGSAYFVIGSFRRDPAVLRACSRNDRRIVRSWRLAAGTAELRRCGQLPRGAESLVASRRI